MQSLRRIAQLGLGIACFSALLCLAGCAAAVPATETAAPPLAIEPQAAGPASATPATLPTPAAPITLTLWHRWPEDQAASVRSILDDYQRGRPGISVTMAYQEDYPVAGGPAADANPDVIVLPSDRIVESVAAGLLAPLDIYVDASWLEENFLPAGVDALRAGGKLWGLPLHVQTLTFFYNQKLIADAELVAKTDQLLERARAYQAEHAGIAYLAYPARADAYFAAPWFYGAGAWYAREDGSVGLDTPAGLEAAAFIASLREIMPADIDYAKADALFKGGKAAITVNGSWYVRELEKAGITYGLQIMPVVGSGGRPARPFVTADGIMLGAKCAQPVEAVRLIAYLAGSESELRMARQHGLVPANKIAIQRATDEGQVIIAHFARQAALGQAMPTTPYLGAATLPVTSLLQALWDGKAPRDVLRVAQSEALADIERARSSGTQP